MINIKKFDSVALSVKEVLQQEALKGDQHKIDKNKNNKIDAQDFKILRGEKKPMKEDSVEEANNPFDVKNYKSQLPTKPGEKAGFDSKKISTGTVYSRKPVKDEPMKKEEVDLSEFSVEDISEFMQTEEFEQLDELSKNLVHRYWGKAIKHHQAVFDKDQDVGQEHQKIKRLMAKTNKGISLGSRGKNPINTPEVQKHLKAASDAVAKMREPAKKLMAKREKGIDKAYTKIHGGKDNQGNKVVRATGRLTKEEYEQIDERTLTKGETAEKERIVKGMKKSLKGFKARYGEKAKSVMYATATKAAKNEEVVTESKRPESDTVPFITNGDSLPLQHAKNLAKKSMKRLKSEMMGKTGTSE